jgi:protein-S-isoprenylcysteine O-methyltransferase Ste14
VKQILQQSLSFILPITALIIVPVSLEDLFVVHGDVLGAFGGIFMVSGLVLLIVTVTMFVRIGRGTLAPWSPTRKLVIRGIYAHVRNPMITGVMMALLGESLLFRSARIFAWSVAFFLINYAYFVLSEEPGLLKRFGNEYKEYREHVPRWIPRLKGWQPSTENPGQSSPC